MNPKPLLLLALLTSTVQGADRPNFVWLISEDNSKHYLQLLDDHGTETPVIEQLASHGLVFDHAFSNSPVCSVARTTLITGCYAPRIGTQFHRRATTVPLPVGLEMFPAYLRQAGYYTTNRSKKDYNAVEGAGVWDESSRRATWRDRTSGQSFFSQAEFRRHPRRLIALLEKGRCETSRPKRIPGSVFVAPYHPDTPTFRYTYARYHDRIRLVDSLVGQVVQQLKDDQLLEDTFIFYFGDHGGVLPGSKGYAYERGLHVPLVVRVPEKWKHVVPWSVGERVSGFVSFVDFGPTLLNLAGLTIPRQVDGRPFLGAGVTTANVESHDEAFGYADRFDEKYDLVRTLRKGRFEYVRSYQPFNFDGLQNNYRYKMLAFAEWRDMFNAGQLNAAQRSFFEARRPELLFDIESDPHETKDLAADPQYANVLSDLRQRMAQRVKGLPDLSFFPESYLVEHAFQNPTQFGQDHAQQIAKLVDIADLSLQPFDSALPAMTEALSADDPWERYWACIVCSCFGKEAEPLATELKRLAASDINLLVRTRAAEFLGLIGVEDPRPTIMDVLAKTRSETEATLVLNSLVLLRDGKPGYDFDLTPEHLDPIVRDANNVQRRLEWLSAP